MTGAVTKSSFDLRFGFRHRGRMTGTDLKEVPNLYELLDSHKRWLEGEDGVRLKLKWADLRGTDLSGRDLRKAGLGNVDLRGCNLTNTDLRETLIFECNLQQANLSEADLRDARFVSSDLTHTNLKGAKLNTASFAVVHSLVGAQVDPKDFEGVMLGRRLERNMPASWQTPRTPISENSPKVDLQAGWLQRLVTVGKGSKGPKSPN